jgi:hypothetical protein
MNEFFLINLNILKYYAGWSIGWMNTILAPSGKRKYRLVPGYQTPFLWVTLPH